MSDLMLIGVLRGPTGATGLELHQFISRAREAADRIEADAAEIKRLRDQLHLAEVVRAAQVEGLVQAAAGWRERATQLEAQVVALGDSAPTTPPPSPSPRS